MTKVVNGVVHHNYVLDYALYYRKRVKRFASFSEAFDFGVSLNKKCFILAEKTQTYIVINPLS